MAVALITGGSAGIGAALADRLASRGYDLLLVARDPVRLRATASDVAGRHGVRADVLVADLGTRRGLLRLTALASGPEAPAVEVLVNNAGCEVAEPFPHGPVEARQAEIDLCVTATMRLTHAVLPGMLRRGSGTVVNVGSVAGRLPSPGSTYGPAKAWIEAFTDSLVPSLAGTGVRALAVCPGPVDTGWNSRERPAGAAGRLLWVDAARVADTALADLDAGRTVSVPGPVHRPLVGVLDLPRRTLRRIGAGARLARRGAELLGDVTRGPLLPARPGAAGAGPSDGAARELRRDPFAVPGCEQIPADAGRPAAAAGPARRPVRLPDLPTRPGAGRADGTASGAGRAERSAATRGGRTAHYLAGGPRTAEQRARAAAAARARGARPVRARG